MKHLKYLAYVLKHKWFVMIECFKMGLFWRGIKHDISKFLPSEWFPYANFFYGNGSEEKFDFAWLRHQKHSDHHWQWWILREDSGNTKIFKMSKRATLEMLCDWCGASKAQGNGGWEGVVKWYINNCTKMELHPDTMKFVDEFLMRKCEDGK